MGKRAGGKHMTFRKGGDSPCAGKGVRIAGVERGALRGENVTGMVAAAGFPVPLLRLLRDFG